MNVQSLYQNNLLIKSYLNYDSKLVILLQGLLSAAKMQKNYYRQPSFDNNISIDLYLEKWERLPLKFNFAFPFQKIMNRIKEVLEEKGVK